MGRILKIFKGLILSIIVIMVVSYWTVPYIAKHIETSNPIKTQSKTIMLKSDQPSQLRMTNKEKIIHRAKNLDTYLSILASNIWYFPVLWINYINIDVKYPKISKESFGMFVDSSKAPINKILKEIDELNIVSTAIRVYITPDYLNSKSYQDNLKLAEELKRRGKSVMLVLAQLKETFSYNIQILVDKVIKDFGEFVDFYQLGEAINRDKWGITNKEKFKRYVISCYNSIIAYDPEAKTVGPSVIDFEWYYTVYYLNLAEDFIDIQGSLLYVDRVKEPENRQNGFNTVEKVHFLKAIAPDKPLWITEVNWPLENTGSFKPTSQKEAVTQQEYRDYMLRYLIELLSDGNVERVYWWATVCERIWFDRPHKYGEISSI